MANQQLDDRLDEFFRLLTVAANGIADIKVDVSVLKTDVSVLKTDVSVLKTDVSVLKTDVSELKREVKTNGRKIDTLAGQFNDVAMMVFKNDDRLSKLELDVAGLKSNVH